MLVFSERSAAPLGKLYNALLTQHPVETSEQSASGGMK
jgi:hypothetical protein